MCLPGGEEEKIGQWVDGESDLRRGKSDSGAAVWMEQSLLKDSLGGHGH